MIESTRSGGVTVLRMAHGKANALDLELCEALAAAVEAERRASARALVLVGQGSIFSAGVDLVRVLEGGAGYVRGFLPALERALRALFFWEKPLVAAINGHAIAGGCVIACAADLRLLARGTARLGVPELRVGVPFPPLALEILRHATAPAALTTLVLDGDTFAPEAALARGLADELVEPHSLLPRAIEAAERLARVPAPAFALAKEALRVPVRAALEREGARLETRFLELWSSPETLAAMRAYVERTLKKPRAEQA
jgi:enoyl-CoA hydratase